MRLLHHGRLAAAFGCLETVTALVQERGHRALAPLHPIGPTAPAEPLGSQRRRQDRLEGPGTILTSWSRWQRGPYWTAKGREGLALWDPRPPQLNSPPGRERARHFHWPQAVSRDPHRSVERFASHGPIGDSCLGARPYGSSLSGMLVPNGPSMACTGLRSASGQLSHFVRLGAER